MKKTLLTLAAAMLLGAVAGTAAVPTLNDFRPKSENVLKDNCAPVKVNKEAKKEGIKRAPTADGYNIDFSGEIDTWYYVAQKNNCTYKCYIYITPEVATALAGNQLTEITFSAASNDATAVRDGSIFVSEDLQADPITSTSVKVINSFKASETYDQTAQLDEPYTIKANTGFYFGYTVKAQYNSLKNITDYPIGVDAENANAFAGYVDVYDKNGAMVSDLNMKEDVGSNLYLKAKTVGDKHSVENIFAVQGGFLDTFTMPVTDKLDNKEATIVISNIGSNDLTTINYTAIVVGGDQMTADAEMNISGGDTDAVMVKVPDLVEGKSLVYIVINSINGADCGQTILLPFIGLGDKGYTRNFLVEEGTGTWCGWCPRGIVGFEYMSQTYPDRFIGIAAHSGDEMETESYLPLFYTYVDGFPGCVINRDPYFIADPSAEELDYLYDIWSTQLGAANIEFTEITNDESSIKVSTKTDFAYSDPESYVRVALVILEDNIPGIQTNYYAGGQYGECGGWESYANPQPWMYKHVARIIDNFDGVEGSLPAEITKGDSYAYTAELSLENVADINNTSIVAILVDNWSGTILNAAEIKAEDYGKLSGIKDMITTPDNAPAEYYNLQGIRMNSADMPAGVYIKRQGSTTQKAIIK